MASIWIPCPKISWVAPVGSTGGQQPQQQKQMLSFQNSSNPNPSLSFASSAPFSGFQVMSSRGLFSLLFFRQFSLSNFSFSLIWPFGYVLRGLFDIKLWFFFFNYLKSWLNLHAKKKWFILFLSVVHIKSVV